MKKQAAQKRSGVAATAPVGVLKVERDGRRVVAHVLPAGKSTPVKRALRTQLKSKRRRTDLFTSPTLPDTLTKAFRDAVRAAQRRYG